MSPQDEAVSTPPSTTYFPVTGSVDGAIAPVDEQDATENMTSKAVRRTRPACMWDRQAVLLG
ncbi:MAG: hypothetical protein A4S17_01235 [Proteobacteria bacterium HN_bin10]|nr:MAG: hypothetical protein A4S17_01235 [Proteobacteria bacterium HN_bin10]